MRADVMLCDFAQVHGGKLFVSGAAIGILATPSPQPPYPISAYIAGVVTVPWDQLDRPHRLVVAVDTADGERLQLVPARGLPTVDSEAGAFTADFTLSRSSLMKPGDDSLMPFAFGIQAPVPHLGAHVAIVELDGEEVARARFRIALVKEGGTLEI